MSPPPTLGASGPPGASATRARSSEGPGERRSARSVATPMERFKASSSLFLRVALGLSFLSALADRFGLWGPFGRPNVSWGNFARFVAYTGQLNWFFPDAAIPS